MTCLKKNWRLHSAKHVNYLVRDHSYITSAWEGRFRKYLFLLMFSTLLIEGMVGGSEKVQKFANIIHGWSLIVSCSFVNPLRQLDPVIN